MNTVLQDFTQLKEDSFILPSHPSHREPTRSIVVLSKNNVSSVILTLLYAYIFSFMNMARARLPSKS